MGDNINANAYWGAALLWAVYSDKVEAATWLLHNGADPDLKHDFVGAHGGTTEGGVNFSTGRMRQGKVFPRGILGWICRPTWIELRMIRVRGRNVTPA